MISSLVSFFAKKKKHFGIDIGTSSVKLVEVEHRGEKPMLKVLASAPLRPEVFQDGNIGDRQALSEMIRDVVIKSGISTPYCVSAVEGQHVFNRFINFPVMSKAEVLEAVKWDAEKYIPYDPGDCYMDAVILAGEPGAREMKVLLVAVGKEVIDTQVEVLQNAELQPLAIDFGALALGRALLGGLGQQNSVILDIGASSTKMTFFKGQAIAFSRTMPFGGSRITRILQEQLGLSWEEAEHYKLRQKELFVSGEGETAEVAQVRNILRLVVNDVKREINRSLEYYQMQNQEDTLTHMVFTGGGSLLPGLKEMLLADLNLHPVGADLSKTVNCGSAFDKTFLQSASPAFSTALGLALWEENP